MQITRELMRHKLATDERWVRRALIRLYERQTAHEQRAESTHNLNGQGFQPADARWFSRLAQWSLRNPGRALSKRQLAVLWRPWRGAPAMCKYADQLLQIVQEDQQKTAAPVQPAITTVQSADCSWCGEQRPGCRCERKRAYALAEQQQEQEAWLAQMRREWSDA